MHTILQASCWCTGHRPNWGQKHRKFLRIFPTLHWNVRESTKLWNTPYTTVILERASVKDSMYCCSNGLTIVRLMHHKGNGGSVPSHPIPSLRLPFILLVGLGGKVVRKAGGGRWKRWKGESLRTLGRLWYYYYYLCTMYIGYMGRYS